MYLLYYIPVAVILLLLGLYSHYECDLVELFFIENSHLPWGIAPVLIRTFNSVIWFLALLIAIPNRFQRNALKVAAIGSTIFTFYFTYHLIRFGSNAGCNCFDIYFPVSLIYVTIGFFIFSITCLLIAYKVERISFAEIIPFRFQLLLLGSGLITVFALSFLLNQISFDSYKEKINRPVELSLLYNSSNKPSVDLTKGKYVIAVMSFSCPYCKIAAKKLRVLKKLDNDLPLYMVLAGKKSNEAKFFNATGSANVPHCKYTDKKTFWTLAENSIPAIYFVNNGVAEHKIHFRDLNEHIINDWLKK